MIKKILLVWAILTLSFCAFSQEEEAAGDLPVQARERNLDVAIGIDEIVRFDYKFNTKIQIGNEDLLRLIVSPAKQEITFQGQKAGRTSVTIRDQVGEIRDRYIITITSDGNSNVVAQLRELIGDVEGLEIGIKGGKVYVGGQIIVPSDIGRVATVLGGYPEVLVLFELSDQTQRVIARKMQEELAKNNLRDVSVRVVNKTFWLEGVVNSQGKKDLAMEIANAYLPDRIKTLASSNTDRVESPRRDAVINFISVNEQKDPPQPKKLVKVSAQFVELTKSYNKTFGFKWAPFMSSAGELSFGKTTQGDVTTSENGTLSGTISNLFPKLNSAKDAGYARVIQSAMIITEDNETGNIKKSSEYAYPVGSGEFQQPQNVSITFDLNVKPEILGEEAVKMELAIAISLPSGSSTAGTPTVTSNSITTKVVVKSKESAVIGGIVQSNSNTDYDRNDPDPVQANQDGGTQAAPLFNLLRSKSYTTSKSQFVVFITPEIIQSATEGTEEIRRKFRKRTR